jgi:hypothetical protein
MRVLVFRDKPHTRDDLTVVGILPGVSLTDWVGPV